jgi:hypothetical protein
MPLFYARKSAMENLAIFSRLRQDLKMAHEFTTSYLKDAITLFHHYKKLGDRAMAQVSDDAITSVPDAESNSIAILVKHMSGNMRSRWRDFLTTDGEKPDRNRDAEFEAPPETRTAAIDLWEAGWKTMFAALESLTDEDMGRTVYINGQAHSVVQAINRQLTHYSYHVGQIVYLAKHYSGSQWKSLTVPRGKTAEAIAKLNSGKDSEQ